MTNKGFSLFEVIIYMAIYASLLVSIIGISSELREISYKNQTSSYLEYEGDFILHKISLLYELDPTILSPTESSSAQSLELGPATTTISVINGTLEFSTSSTTIKISSLSIRVNTISFSIIPIPNTTQSNIHIAFSLSALSGTGARVSRNFSDSFSTDL